MVEVASGKGQKMIEGCPVVELHDRPEDFHLMLQVIYFPGTLPIEKLRQATFEKLEPIFTLADKYEMTSLTERLLPTLERDWPITLAAWDANEAEIKWFQEAMEREFDYVDRWNDEDLVKVGDVFPEPCRVIALARLCGLESVLPAAFYHLSRIDASYDPEDDYNDVWEFRYLGGRLADTVHLPTEEWETLYRGTSAIRNWCYNFLTIFNLRSKEINRHVEESDEHENCSEGLQAIRTPLEARLLQRKGEGWGIDPLEVLADFQKLGHRDNLCSECASRLRRKLYQKRRELWNELPGFFGLEGWANPETWTSDDD